MSGEWKFQRIQYSTTITLVPGISEYLLFNESCLHDSNRVTDVCEKDIIHWLLQTSFVPLFHEYVGFNYKPLIFTEIAKPFINSSNHIPGDIDVLMVYDSNVKQAVAMQCKRIKVKYTDSESAKKNKVSIIKHGVKQCNLMNKEFHFYKSYLVLLIEVDSYRQDKKNVFFRTLQERDRQEIINTVFQHKLANEIGILLIEITQPANNSFKNMNAISPLLIKTALEQKQLDTTNNKVWELLRNKEQYRYF